MPPVVLAVDRADPALRRHVEADRRVERVEEYSQGRGLPRAIRPEEPDDLTRRGIKVRLSTTATSRIWRRTRLLIVASALASRSWTLYTFRNSRTRIAGEAASSIGTSTPTAKVYRRDAETQRIAARIASEHLFLRVLLCAPVASPRLRGEATP